MTEISDAPALRCSGLTKRYPGVRALDGLKLTAVAGEVHAILGENGAGKSTFIKALGGSVPLDSGRVEVFGREARIDTPDAARQLGIEVAYQELSLIPDLTVAQNIWLRRSRPGRSRILSTAKLRRRTYELYDRLEAPRVDPDSVIRHLSVAERQLVEIVGSVASDPSIVIFDEATASLPAAETRWVLTLARNLAASGRLVLFISHRLPEIRQVADRVTILRDGRHIVSSEAEALTDDEMIEAMLGRKPQRLYPPPVAPPGDTVFLSVEDLHVDHRVRGVSFELREGEILGVGGLQGQGQSALLGALFGLSTAHGVVRVCGKPVRIRSPRAAFRAGIGLALVPEDRRNEGLLGPKSLRENLTLPVLDDMTRWGLMSGRREDAAVAQAMERLEIKAASPEQAASTLSGGNQQKVVIAKLLLVGARILLFHDLTRGIDVGTKAQIFGLARRLAAEGHAILMYSSDNTELVNLCDRVLVMSRGELAATLCGARISEENIMRAAFDVERPEAEIAPDDGLDIEVSTVEGR